MRIAIIGSGNVGRALAEATQRAGHEVLLSSANPENARAVAEEVGVRAVSASREAVSHAEVVVLAVPYASLNEILEDLNGALHGKIIVDVTNPVKPDYSGLLNPAVSAAELIQSRLPAARVVKALNTVFALRQRQPEVDGMRLDGYVAGDDAEAKRVVLDLVESIGLRPIDAGPLSMAPALESLALLNMSLQLRHEWPWQSGWKLVGPTGSESS